MNPMSLLNQLHRWVGESRRNQLLAAGAALVAVGLAAVGVVLALSGDGDGLGEVVVHTTTQSPSPSSTRPSRAPELTATPAVITEPEFQGTIYFSSFDVEAQQHVVHSVRPDGTGLTIVATLPSGALGFSLSPNAELLAFTGGSTEADDDIYTLSIASGIVTNITNTPRQPTLTNDESMLGWSPDGKLAAIKTHHLPIPPGPGDYDSLELIAPDGSGRQSLIPEDFFLRTPAVITSLDWSSAGDAFVFRMLTAADEAQGGHLFLMKSDGSGMKDISGPILNSDVGGASWRPDGQAVAMSLANAGLYLLDVSGYEQRGSTQLQAALSAYEIKWSLSGSMLAIWGPGGLAVMDATGADLKTVANDFRPGSGFAWSPGGDEIAYVALGGPCAEGCPPGPLTLVNASGTRFRALTEMPIDAVLGWFPELGEITENLNIRSEPSIGSPVIGSLEKGDRVGLLGQVQGEEAEPGSGNRVWYKTSRGYVYSAYVRRQP